MIKAPKTKHEIRRWMRDNRSRFADYGTEEVNLTEMVETWDREQATGSDTLDPDHIAWEIATEFSEG